MFTRIRLILSINSTYNIHKCDDMFVLNILYIHRSFVARTVFFFFFFFFERCKSWCNITLYFDITWYDQWFTMVYIWTELPCISDLFGWYEWVMMGTVTSRVRRGSACSSPRSLCPDWQYTVTVSDWWFCYSNMFFPSHFGTTNNKVYVFPFGDLRTSWYHDELNLFQIVGSVLQIPLKWSRMLPFQCYVIHKIVPWRTALKIKINPFFSHVFSKKDPRCFFPAIG